MASFEAVLLLLGAVLLSCIINQLLPGISVPLIQVALGFLISYFLPEFEPRFETNVFLLLFIAPLLFHDASMSDRAALWRLKIPIAALVVGLVVVSTVLTGYAVQTLLPFLPLAACFALGASLGPTDAVSVAALSERASIPHDEEIVLQGESLFNDASGIVAFQVAVAALLTGTFSPLKAGGSFLLTFFGGLVVGLALAGLRSLLVRWVRSKGMENATFHVLIELLTPFVVFLVAEHFEVSGIIAVVATGLTHGLFATRTTPTTARLRLVSNSVWSVLSFALNGFVFLLLGSQLPHIVSQTLQEGSQGQSYSLQLLFYVLVLTIFVLIVRFIWTFALMFVRTRIEHRSPQRIRQHLRPAATLTIAGVRGTVTLATIFTLPWYLRDGSAFPHRALLVFLASGVILTSMVLANFVVPRLAPTHNTLLDENEAETLMDILREVLIKLRDQMTEENRRATEEVMHSYKTRITYIKTHNEIDDAGRDRLRVVTLDWEKENTIMLMRLHRVPTTAGVFCLFHISRLRERVHHGNKSRWHWIIAALRDFRKQMKILKQARPYQKPVERSKANGALALLTILNYDYVLDRLEKLVTASTEERSAVGVEGVEIEDISSLLVEYQRRRDVFEARQKRKRPQIDVRANAQHNKDTASNEKNMPDEPSKASEPHKKGRGRGGAHLLELLPQINELKALGLQLERDAITQRFDEGKISRKRAKELRDNVAIMELDLGDEG